MQLTLPRQDGAAWGRLWSRAAAPSSCPSTTKPQPGKRSLYPRTRRSKQGTIGSEAAPRSGLLEAGWLTTPLMALKAEARRASETPGVRSGGASYRASTRGGRSHHVKGSSCPSRGVPIAGHGRWSRASRLGTRREAPAGFSLYRWQPRWMPTRRKVVKTSPLHRQSTRMGTHPRPCLMEPARGPHPRRRPSSRCASARCVVHSSPSS